VLLVATGMGAAVALAVFVFLHGPEGTARALAPATGGAAAPVVGEATLVLASSPAGAEVVRQSDGALLGATPVRDVAPADGRREEYRVRRPGYVEEIFAFEFRGEGEHHRTVALAPAPRPPAAAAIDEGGRRGGRRQREARRGAGAAGPAEAAEPAEPPAAAETQRGAASPPPAPARAAERPTTPAPAPAARDLPAEDLPPLLPSVRVKRLGRR
jgi:hypothetical protein